VVLDQPRGEHAAELAFRHPVSGEVVRFRSDWPDDLRPALDAAAHPERVAGSDPLACLDFFLDPDA
jgi:hypothetical protein